MTITWTAAGGTDVGRVREGNEDAFRVVLERGIFLVADGMGGHAAGEVASAVAADAALETVTSATAAADHPRSAIREAYAEAHRRMFDRNQADPSLDGMGTTLTMALLDNAGALHIGHIGDSRIYHLSGGDLSLLTHDHTWTQQEVDAGRLTEEAARRHPFSHVLARVLTVDEPAEPDIRSTVVVPGDMLLLCSDGLHNMVDNRGLQDILRTSGGPEAIVRMLIDTANRRGGPDNITAIVVVVGETGAVAAY